MAKQMEVIGLDIGSNTIKLVHLNQEGNGVEILDYKIIDRDGKDISDTEIYKEVVSFIQSKGKDIPLVASIEGSQVFTRVFKLPAVGKSKLAKIVGYEAQQQVPFPIAEVVWSYQCLRKVSAEEADVVLVAVKKNIIENILNVFKGLNVSIKDVAAPVTALYNLLEYQLPEQNRATLILDLGDKTTNILITEEQNLWFRTIPLGGEIITKAISQEFNLDLTEAENIKKEKGCIILESSPSDDPLTKQISSCIVRAINRLTGEIARSVEVYSSSFNSLGVKRILITGGFSRLPNIDLLLAKKFRVDVERLDVLKGFSISPAIKKERLLNDAPSLGVALGLGLQQLGLGRFKLSLLPKEVLKKQEWKKRQAYVAVMGLLLVFLGFSFSGYNMQLSAIYRANINKLRIEKEIMDSNKEKLLDTRRQLEEVKARMDIISDVANARTLWIDMLLALEEIIPQDVWLTKIKPVVEEGSPAVTRDRDMDKRSAEREKSLVEYLHKTDYIDLELAGKTSGVYQQIVAFRDALDKAKYFVAGASRVVSASPPKDGVRDFVIKVSLRTRLEEESPTPASGQGIEIKNNTDERK